MAKFKSRPRFVDAEQYVFGQPLPRGVYQGREGTYVVTIHLQQCNVVSGDWIIAEPDGTHFYPCKPDIFEKSYEPA